MINTHPLHALCVCHLISSAIQHRDIMQPNVTLTVLVVRCHVARRRCRMSLVLGACTVISDLWHMQYPFSTAEHSTLTFPIKAQKDGCTCAKSFQHEVLVMQSRRRLSQSPLMWHLLHPSKGHSLSPLAQIVSLHTSLKLPVCSAARHHVVEQMQKSDGTESHETVCHFWK